MENKTIDENKNSSKWKVILGAILAVLVIVYIIGAVYFQNRFLFGTKIGEEKVGGKTLKQVETMLAKNAKEYELTLTGRQGYKDKITGKDIDFKVTIGDSLNNGLEKQNPFLWFLGASGDEKELYADVSYDKEKLSNVIKQLDCFKKKNIIEPQNATLVLKNDKFQIQKEVWGTRVKKEVLNKAIKEALSSVDPTLNLKSEKCYENPTVLKDDKKLTSGKEAAEKLANVTITYDFDYTTEKVTPKMIRKWIDFDKNCNPELSYDRVLDYIEDLAKKYDTYSTVRTVKDAAGNDHKIYFGSYGWKISQTKEAKKLMSVIKKGKSVKREPIYLYKAVCRKKGNIDWDDTYALVNIKDQAMVFIKDGKVVVSSSVVTGDVTKGHGTPTGAYELMYKTRNQTLRGQGYASAVSYWMPFTTNVGFHDASWRSSFGGSSYYGNGSHGCVNMPAGNAAALYSVIEPGTPVFVY